MKTLARFAFIASGMTLALAGPWALGAEEAESDADEAEETTGYIEEIVVEGERGEQRTLDRAMTVTGFNAGMIEELGIQNTDDLEVLVPGLQVGVRSHAGKNEDGHLVMRGVANDRRVNFFQDSSVAVYIDGVYTPVSYGLDAGMFDVERVEVARGPQGTTGGKTAIAGSISFVTKKPTPEWDMVASAEYTDQFSQRYNVAFGGPIADSNFSYRLALGRLTGDGLIENVGAGPDAGKPDQLQYAPQLRFTNDRLDVTTRYTKLRDTGVQKVSLIIGARNTEEQFFLLNDGTPRCETDRDPDSPTFNECIRDSNGNIVYYINPYFGLGQNPAIEDCPGFNSDGSRDPGHPVVCEGKYLKLKTELNAPIGENNSQEAFTIEAHFKLNDTHEIVYHYGNRDTRTDISNDQDGTNRQPGGRCLAIHPRVISGELQEGQTHPRCALDERGNGVYGDSISNYLRTSDQQSHEISLISNNEGRLNYTVGYTYLSGDEPYVYRSTFNGVETGSSNLNNPAFYTDTTAACAGWLQNQGDGIWPNIRDRNDPANALAPGWIAGCYGDEFSANWSDVTNGTTHAVGSGVSGAFYGNVTYEQAAVYGNVEYVLNDRWKVFGGLRYNDDHKEHDQNDFSSAGQRTLEDGTVINIVNGIFRSKHYDAPCCGYVGLHKDANGEYIPDDRTLADSKVKTWRETTWSFGAEYVPSDNTMYYGRISRGYRAGGFAGFGNRLGEAFDPEIVINYEAGVKGLFREDKLQLEVSAYFQDFSSFWTQSQRLRTVEERRPGESLYTGETNAVDGTNIAGIEAQGAFRISDRLLVRGFYEYMYSSFGDYQTRYCCTPGGTTAAPSTTMVEGPDGVLIEVVDTGTVNFGGHSLRMQPEHKLSAAASYAVPMPGDRGSLDVVTIMSWRDKMYPDEGNLDIYAIPAYTRWDLRANWVSADGRYSVSGWVTNLLDVVQVQSYSPRDGNGVTAPVHGSVTDSRRIGLTFNYRMAGE